MRDTDPVPTPLPGYQSIKVDISSLESFAASLRAELEQDFIPQVQAAKRHLQSNAPFTYAREFVEVRAAAHRYTQVRDLAIRQLNAYIEAIDTLTTAAVSIAGNYRQADKGASVNLLDSQIRGQVGK